MNDYAREDTGGQGDRLLDTAWQDVAGQREWDNPVVLCVQLNRKASLPVR